MPGAWCKVSRILWEPSPCDFTEPLQYYSSIVLRQTALSACTFYIPDPALTLPVEVHAGADLRLPLAAALEHILGRKFGLGGCVYKSKSKRAKKTS